MAQGSLSILQKIYFNFFYREVMRLKRGDASNPLVSNILRPKSNFLRPKSNTL